MNGPHDLGGAMGFGPIAPEADEPVFHAPWESRALAITLACGATGSWTLDTSRHRRERIAPADYLASSYYDIWITGLERLLVDHGLVTDEELATGAPVTSPARVRRVITADEVPAALARGAPCSRDPVTPARFSAGDRVTARNEHKTTHTRLPRYVRGHVGRIVSVEGVFVLPDTNAHGLGENPEWLYRVMFEGRELWGKAADPTLSVTVDLWESYLDPA